MMLIIRNYHLVISYHLLCTIGYSDQIPVQYASSYLQGDFEQDMLGGNRQWIPLKLNASGLCLSSCANVCLFQLP
jgi:preprotein translocase subunit SecY